MARLRFDLLHISHRWGPETFLGRGLKGVVASGRCHDAPDQSKAYRLWPIRLRASSPARPGWLETVHFSPGADQGASTAPMDPLCSLPADDGCHDRCMPQRQCPRHGPTEGQITAVHGASRRKVSSLDLFRGCTKRPGHGMRCLGDAVLVSVWPVLRAVVDRVRTNGSRPVCFLAFFSHEACSATSGRETDEAPACLPCPCSRGTAPRRCRWER